jgi:hypothetical protein
MTSGVVTAPLLEEAEYRPMIKAEASKTKGPLFLWKEAFLFKLFPSFIPGSPKQLKLEDDYF